MLLHSATAVIIGGGVIGSAIFERLSSAFPKSVVLIEKGKIASGATGKSAGIARAYQPGRLAHPFAEYQELLTSRQESAGTPLPTLHIAAQMSEQGSLEHEERPSVPHRYPHLRISSDEEAWIEESSGYYDPSAVTRALVALGESHGGTVIEHTEAIDLMLSTDEVVGIRTSRGEIRTCAVILATGAWTEKLSARWRLALPVFAKGLQMNRYIGLGDSFETPIFIDEPLKLYGRGDGPGAALVGMPMPRESVDPDLPRETDESHKKEITARACQRFTWDERVVLASTIAGCDAYTESGDALVSRHPTIQGLYIATGFSGGGFKRAPSVARTVCEIVREDIQQGDVCA